MEVNPRLTEKGCRDFALVKDALENGSQRAFNTLLDIYWDVVYFMMLKMTSSREDAEDLSIEVFAKAFRSLDQYSPAFAFSTWLFRIASNHGIDFLRKQKKNVLGAKGNEEIDQSDVLFTLSSDSDSPDSGITREQRIAVVGMLVERLKPAYRQLVRMRYFDEKSYEEIADELNLPLGTVKAQLFRAREFMLQIVLRTGTSL